MLDFELKAQYDLVDLEKLVALLRSENGCPWDRIQTHESIRRNFIEEAYEVAEAIDQKDPEHLKEELGDVLLQVMFHSRIEEEAGNFNINDVADAICKKLVYRHPHIFEGTKVIDTNEVLENWEELKRLERNQETIGSGMDHVAGSLPALWRAEKIQSKAAKAGFDWDDITAALSKLSEELEELKTAVLNDSNKEEELGDLLFAAVNVARYISCDPEIALNASSDKFIFRFKHLERRAHELGRELTEMSLPEMDKLYDEAKKL
ncbi:MAG: nucleoside triphosphate pyrophosphohydrolase [Clostridiales bacterium]|nr:nucleoside triphosphate pyrophosphohydrolase [Clostridiales bacterium]